MGKRGALTQGELEYLQRRKVQGASHRQVATELGCAVETVRKKWKALRYHQVSRRTGRPALGVLAAYSVGIAQQAVAIKQAHPHWGPANVRVELMHQLERSEAELPSLSRLAVLFKQQCPEAVQPRHPRVKPEPLPATVRVHQRWQIDAVEKIPFGTGQFATALEIREPVGALMIASQAFETTHLPGRTWRKLTLAEVRQTLRQAMARWGRPAEVQSDHEGVYAGAKQNDFPMPFTLWLLGLGIQHIFSHIGRPTDQAQGERSHRSQGDMSWKDEALDSLAILQQHLDQSCQRYNQELPVHAGHCQGQPPLKTDPQAGYTGRPFDPSLEYELFDLAAIDQFLANRVWTRKADKNGIVWLGSCTYYLSRRVKGQTLTIHFLPETRSFQFENTTHGTQIMLPAQGLSKADLTGLVPLPLPAHRVFQYPLPLVGV